MHDFSRRAIRRFESELDESYPRIEDNADAPGSSQSAAAARLRHSRSSVPRGQESWRGVRALCSVAALSEAGRRGIGTTHEGEDIVGFLVDRSHDHRLPRCDARTQRDSEFQYDPAMDVQDCQARHLSRRSKPSNLELHARYPVARSQHEGTGDYYARLVSWYTN